jgi:hypothetical protein
MVRGWRPGTPSALQGPDLRRYSRSGSSKAKYWPIATSLYAALTHSICRGYRANPRKSVRGESAHRNAWTMPSALARPHRRRRIICRNLGGPQRHEVAALVGIAADLGTVPAAHVSFQLVNRRRLRPAHDIEGNRLVCVAAEAADLEVAITCVQSVAERGRRLGRPGGMSTM